MLLLHDHWHYVYPLFLSNNGSCQHQDKSYKQRYSRACFVSRILSFPELFSPQRYKPHHAYALSQWQILSTFFSVSQQQWWLAVWLLALVDVPAQERFPFRSEPCNLISSKILLIQLHIYTTLCECTPTLYAHSSISIKKDLAWHNLETTTTDSLDRSNWNRLHWYNLTKWRLVTLSSCCIFYSKSNVEGTTLLWPALLFDNQILVNASRRASLDQLTSWSTRSWATFRRLPPFVRFSFILFHYSQERYPNMHHSLITLVVLKQQRWQSLIIACCPTIVGVLQLQLIFKTVSVTESLTRSRLLFSCGSNRDE